MRRALACALALSLLGSAGCGGRSRERDRGEAAGGEQARELRERGDQLKGVPTVDRSAYYEIATAAGLLRARSALVAGGRRVDGRLAAQVHAAGHLVDRTRPRDRALGALRARIAPILRRRAPPTPAAARRELAFVDSLTAALDRFVRGNPGYTALQPD
ncbi:MAG TPA: hypothetical protein VIM22_04080 [Solirubrobacteraceae bacterium]|jgi:hypothetical protein